MSAEKATQEQGIDVTAGQEKKYLQGRDILKWGIIGLVGFVVLILVFGVGVKVGTIKARYSYRWAENYHKNFAGPKGGFFGDWRKVPPFPGDFIEGHGAFGEIIELKDNSFVIKGRGDIEKIVITTKDTVVKKGMETVKDGLKVGDYAVVIGSPNEEGQIEAKMIRIFEKKSLMPFKPRRFPFL